MGYGNMRLGDIRSLVCENPTYTSFMRERATKTGRGCEALQWTPLDRISGLLLGAAIKGEDPRFFIHRGIDFKITLEAVRGAARHRRPVRGVSSITQQTARNLFLTPKRSFARKGLEGAYALGMEHILSKQRIIEIYLNIIEFGEGIWGCTAAADHYFCKHPQDLDLFESIFLISLLPAPRAHLIGKNLERAWCSQMQILHVMYLSEFATVRQFATALEKAKGVYRLLADGADLETALAYSPATVATPLLPIMNEDDKCGCSAQKLLETKAGLQRELERRRILERRFDRLTLQKAIMTTDYSLLTGMGGQFRS